jgi:hypothetical protein
LRRWIAPALGLGLLASGAAMALGMSSVQGPLVAVLVAAAIIGVGKWRIDHDRGGS